MLTTYKYRLYPNLKQRELLEKHFGSVRFIYNWGLDLKVKAYQTDKKNLSCFDLIKKLPELKDKEEFKWLNDINAQALQASLRNLDNAFTRFFRLKKGFPKFKSRKNEKRSFTCPQRLKTDFDAGFIYIPKFTEGIKCVFHRTFKGSIKQTIIKKMPSGRYFVCIIVKEEDSNIKNKAIKESTSIGLDLGLTNFITTSNGLKIDNPKFLYKLSKKLTKAQKILARKKKDSKNYQKQKIKAARIHEKVVNCRTDFLHKLTRQLVNENQVNTFCLEDLNIEKMQKTKHLARLIADVSWSQFIDFLTYKAERVGKNVIKIGRFDPSSKLCTCGNINKDLKLSDRTWICPVCKTEHDRDILAARNIKQFALNKQNLIGHELSKSKPVEKVRNKLTSVKQETRNLK